MGVQLVCPQPRAPANGPPGPPKVAAARTQVLAATQSVAITCAQIATMPKNSASDAKVAASSTTARTPADRTRREHSSYSVLSQLVVVGHDPLPNPRLVSGQYPT